MWWQLTLTLIAIAGGVWAVHWSAAKAHREHMQDLADIVQRELDDNCLGDEASHVKPLYDEQLMQHMAAEREWEACSFGIITKEEREWLDSLGTESSHIRPIYRDDDEHLIGFVRESRDG